jgi:hypothetical protein
MNRLTIFLLSGMLLLASGARAQYATDKKKAWINSNLIDDHAVCYVFYQTSEEGLNRDTTKSKVDYKNLTDAIINKMFILAKNSSIKEEAILAKIELTMNDFKKQMGGDFKNYSIVLNKYGQFCKDLIVNPEPRMRYWVDRSIKENR